jgi:hypothetical protein
VAHSYRCDSECNIGESGGVFEWATQMGAILGVILVNCVGYLSGPLQWVRFWLQYG